MTAIIALDIQLTFRERLQFPPIRSKCGISLCQWVVLNEPSRTGTMLIGGKIEWLPASSQRKGMSTVSLVASSISRLPDKLYAGKYGRTAQLEPGLETLLDLFGTVLAERCPCSQIIPKPGLVVLNEACFFWSNLVLFWNQRMIPSLPTNQVLGVLAGET